MNFVETLLKLLKEKNVTKNKMLCDLNLSKNSFVAWAKRGTIPSGETLAKIADYFNVSTDYLLGKTDEKNKPAEILDERAVRLNELMKGLTPSEIDQLLDYVRFLSERNKDKK